MAWFRRDAGRGRIEGILLLTILASVVFIVLRGYRAGLLYDPSDIVIPVTFDDAFTFYKMRSDGRDGMTVTATTGLTGVPSIDFAVDMRKASHLLESDFDRCRQILVAIKPKPRSVPFSGGADRLFIDGKLVGRLSSQRLLDDPRVYSPRARGAQIYVVRAPDSIARPAERWILRLEDPNVGDRIYSISIVIAKACLTTRPLGAYDHEGT